MRRWTSHEADAGTIDVAVFWLAVGPLTPGLFCRPPLLPNPYSLKRLSAEFFF